MFQAGTLKAKGFYLGLAVFLGGVSVIITAVSTGEFSHMNEGIIAAIGGLGTMFARDTAQKVMNKE